MNGRARRTLTHPSPSHVLSANSWETLTNVMLRSVISVAQMPRRRTITSVPTQTKGVKKKRHGNPIRRKPLSLPSHLFDAVWSAEGEQSYQQAEQHEKQQTAVLQKRGPRNRRLWRRHSGTDTVILFKVSGRNTIQPASCKNSATAWPTLSRADCQKNICRRSRSASSPHTCISAAASGCRRRIFAGERKPWGNAPVGRETL